MCLISSQHITHFVAKQLLLKCSKLLSEKHNGQRSTTDYFLSTNIMSPKSFHSHFKTLQMSFNSLDRSENLPPCSHEL